MQHPSHDLDKLEGLDISDVCFVLDYIEIHFDGPILRCFVKPTVKKDGMQFDSNQQGYRDALCSIINYKISKVELREEECISIEIEDGITIDVPSNTKSAILPETAQLYLSPEEGSQIF